MFLVKPFPVPKVSGYGLPASYQVVSAVEFLLHFLPYSDGNVVPAAEHYSAGEERLGMVV